MSSAKNRKLLMFHCLANTLSVLRGKDLAEMARISERTVKYDLMDLRDFAEACGCILHSKKGEGYWLEVIDHKRFNEVNEQLTIRFSNVKYTQRDALIRADEVMRELIVRDEFIKVEDIAEGLFVSRNTIKTELKLAHAFFESFALVLESKPNYGVKVVGEEWNRRLCMLELCEVHYSHAINLVGSSDYAQYFIYDDAVCQAIRQAYLKVLCSCDYTILDPFANRLLRYFMIMQRRISLSFHVSIPTEKASILRAMREYTVAERVIEALQPHGSFAISEDELMAIELMLLIWMDITPQRATVENYGNFYTQAKSLSGGIKKTIYEHWNIVFVNEEYYDTTLTAALIPIVIQIAFHCVQFSVTGLHVEENGIKASPLALTLAKTAAAYIEKEMHCVLNDNAVNALAVRMFACIDQLQYTHTPRRVIICSRNGQQAAEIIRNKILTRYRKKWFKELSICGFYEVRGRAQEDYDYIILNFDSYSYRYQIPYLVVDQIPTYKQMEEIYNKIILSGYDLKQIFEQCHWQSKGCVFTNSSYESRNTFVTMLAYKWAKDANAMPDLQRAIKKYDDTYIYKECLTIIIRATHTGKNVFEIYELPKQESWQQKLIKHIIFIAIDFHEDAQIVRFVEHVTSLLVYDENKRRQIMQDTSVDGITDMVIQQLKAG